MTVRDIIAGSLRLIGVLASGETASASDEADSLSALNQMLESWSTSGLLVYQSSRESFALIPSQQTYTMGDGGNFDTERPVKIIRATTEQNDYEFDLEIVDTVEKWACITPKDQQSTLAQKIFPNGSSPLLSLSLWPIPTQANNLILYTLKPLAAFASVNDDVELPPGFARAIRYNLAMELAPEFGREPSGLVMKAARDSKTEIVRQNFKPTYLKSDAAGLTNRAPYNIWKGE